jgi:N-dimethylarginine dimethylaminohydrolase
MVEPAGDAFEVRPQVRLGVRTDSDRLTAVGISSPALFRQVEAINLRMKAEYEGSPVDVGQLIAEHANVRSALEANGVTVVDLLPHPALPYMLNVRDVGVVINEDFIAGRMMYPVRSHEPFWIQGQLTRIANMPRITTVEKGHVEGGDVFPEGNTLFVGMSQRSDGLGAQSLLEIVGSGVALREIGLESTVLHLDTVFNIVGRIAVVCPSALKAYDRTLEALREASIDDVIEVSREEADAYCTNFLVLRPDLVLMASGSDRVAGELERLGVTVQRVSMTEHHRLGGSIRCMTLPLSRE